MNLLLIYFSFQPKKQRFQDVNKKSRECPFNLRERLQQKDNFNFFLYILKTSVPESKQKQIHPILLQHLSKNILLITKIRSDTSVMLFGCLEDKGNTKEKCHLSQKVNVHLVGKIPKGKL